MDIILPTLTPGGKTPPCPEVSIISNGNLENRKKSTGFAPLQENQNKINLKGFNKFSN